MSTQQATGISGGTFHAPVTVHVTGANVIQCLPEQQSILPSAFSKNTIDATKKTEPFNPSATTLSIFNVPAPHLRFGSSRTEQLNEIYQRLTEGQSRENWNIVKLVGMPGIGKSQIAKKFAYLQQNYYQNRCWFINAAKKDFILEAFKEKAELFRINQIYLPKLIKSVYTSLESQGQKTLIIFDNVKGAADIRPFLPEDIPNKKNFDIILTAQHHNIYSVYLPTIRLKPTDANIQQDSLRFITELFSDSQLTFPEKDINSLLIKLGYLPLAVEQAALYIIRYHGRISVQRYLDIYDKAREKFLVEVLQVDDNLSVFTVLKLALDELKQTNNIALDMLYTCAYLANNGVPQKQLEAYFAEQIEYFKKQDIDEAKKSAEEAVLILHEYSLIELNQYDSSFNIHCLIQDIMQIQAEKSEENRQHALSQKIINVLEVAINYLCQKIIFEQESVIGQSTNFIQRSFQYDHHNKEKLSKLHVLLPHALQVINHANRLNYASKALFQLVYTVGVYYQAADYSVDKAKKYLEKAKTLAEKVETTAYDKYKLYRQLSKTYLRNASTAKSNDRKSSLFDLALKYLQQATAAMVDISFHDERRKLKLEIEHLCDWANFYSYNIEYFDNKLIEGNLNNQNAYAQTAKVRSQQVTEYQVINDGKLALDKALDLAVQLEDDTAKGIIYHYWGTYFAHPVVKEYDLAINNYERAIEFKKQFENGREIARSYCQLGFAWLKKYKASGKNKRLLDNAINNLIEGLKYFLLFHDNLTHPEVLNALDKLAICYTKRDKSFLLFKALQIRLVISTSLAGLKKNDSSNDIKIIKLYMKIGHFNEAKYYFSNLNNLPVKKQIAFTEKLKGKQKHVITSYFKLEPIKKIEYSVKTLQEFLGNPGAINTLSSDNADKQYQKPANSNSNVEYNNNKRKGDSHIVDEPANKRQKTFNAVRCFATSEGIYNALRIELGKTSVHIINPELCTGSTPLNSEEGLKNYGEKIAGYYDADGQFHDNGFLQQDGGELKKPIVMILNTMAAKARTATDTSATGGIHWVCCVILPKVYRWKEQEFKHEYERIYYIDSLGQANLPIDFKKLFREGRSFTFERHAGTSQGGHVVGTSTHKIPSAFPKAEFIDCYANQQAPHSNDCGWWALYNAIQVVKTGGDDFLRKFDDQTLENADNLREQYPDLAETQPYGNSEFDEGSIMERMADQIRAFNLSKKNSVEVISNGANQIKPLELQELVSSSKISTSCQQTRNIARISHIQNNSISRLVKSNKAWLHFTGAKAENSQEDLRRYNTWYDTQTLQYLVHQQPNQQSLVYVFERSSFATELSELVGLRTLLNKPVGFISMEPGQTQTSHFIAGWLTVDNCLLIVNPIGLTQHRDFYQQLADVQKSLGLKYIYLSQTLIQRDVQGIFSCGPLCVEILRHWMQVIPQLQDIDAELIHKDDLDYLLIGGTSLLPDNLLSISRLASTGYRKALEDLREAHANLLVGEQSSSITSTEDFWHVVCENHPLQALVRRLLNKEFNLLTVEETDEFKQLSQLNGHILAKQNLFYTENSGAGVSTIQQTRAETQGYSQRLFAHNNANISNAVNPSLTENDARANEQQRYNGPA